MATATPWSLPSPSGSWPQATGRCLGTELDDRGQVQTNLVSAPHFFLPQA